MSQRRLDYGDYTVGWVCALPTELAAAQTVLDEEHQTLQDDDGSALYTLGRIGQHNVVILCLPAGVIGTNSAAAAAVRMQIRYKSIKFGLMVGIGGGVPSLEDDPDIRLGDVVISQPHNGHGGVVQYDIGRTTSDGLERTGYLNTPPPILLSALAKLQANHQRDKSSLSTYLAAFSGLSKFSRDKAGPDVLFEPSYQHVPGRQCVNCDPSKLVKRPTRTGHTKIHYGTIASANQVMKDGDARDRLSSKLGGVLCFEMEAAGLMNNFPCLVIRGICDYADSHKPKSWQPYAAATAAACAKELLSVIPGGDTAPTTPIPGTISNQASRFGDMHSLGLTLYKHQKYRSSEREFRKAAEAHEELVGRYHHDTLESIYWLGCSLYKQGKYGIAEQEFRKAVEGHEKSPGTDIYATFRPMLGKSLYKQGDHSAAEQEFRKAAEGYEKLLGKYHHGTLNSIKWLGKSLYKQGKHTAAEQEFRKEAKVHEKFLGKDHHDTLHSIHWLSKSLYKQGEHSAAEQEFRKAAEGHEKLLGKYHHDTLKSIKWLGKSLNRQGKHGAAEKEFGKVKEGQERLSRKRTLQMMERSSQ